MRLVKTDLARQALAPGSRILTPKERAVVLLADGRRTCEDLLELTDIPLGMVGDLVSRGFLSSVGEPAARKANAANERTPPVQQAALSSEVGGDVSSRRKQSPAATKMYLMDIAERTFSRYDSAQWEKLRDVLRDAYDEERLVRAAGMVVQAVRRASGEDRATVIQHQLLRHGVLVDAKNESA